jgi:bifunctional non-homologous end joining protein LigD
MAAALSALPARDAILDGELVMLTPGGTSSFQALQNVLSSGRTADLVFYAFDLMHLDGMDLRGSPLLARKEALRGLLAGDPAGPVRFSDHIVGSGGVFHQQACAMGLEGIICKRADAPYAQKRTKDWLKVKCLLRQEFVIGGFTEPRGSRSHFGALHVGVYRDGELVHAGKVGTGFNEEVLRQVHARLKKLKRADSPFSDFGRRGRQPAGVTWVEPTLVCEVEFTEWTGDGILRHPVFQGLREDKPATQVVREDPRAPGAGESAAAGSDPSTAKGRARAPARGASKDAPAAPSSRPVPPSTKSASPRRGKAPDVEVEGIRLSNPDKVLFPALGTTKLDLARYYEAIGERMLPHIADRPLTLVRCPEGVGGQCFYQKHGDEHFPAQVGRTTILENDGDPRVYTYVDSVAGVVAAAFQVRDRLDELGLRSWVKTTGGKGLHVVVPIARRSSWDEVKDFTRALSADLSAANPGKYLIKATKAARKGKIFLDYLRNGRGATAICAYCVRARPTGAVSVPIAWDELTADLRTDDFTPRAVVERIQSLQADPWADYWIVRQSITKQMRAAVGLK